MIQVAVFVPVAGDDAPTALVQIVQGDANITVGTLKAGEQGQYSVFPGTKLVVMEKPKS